ncbi:hypothetical protein WOLCODRAFT_136739 [Wolfiporia cocos MD-104 SS10]|uniref:YTH domain-containing protein n=1 Tax=Wolfiporia cocos (strain MD-104) TaxID=742152 RepID=A0A2H3JDF3_WOLCO|nr:hypothetical protein WOLCODRAFT_136739 [Wolfiporia cocos MD-104 SS10]
MPFNVSPREVEAYPQASPSSIPSPRYSMSPRAGVHYPHAQQPPPALLDTPPIPPVRSTTASSPTASSTAPRQKSSEAEASAPPSSSRPAPYRRSQQVHSPAQRSEWVMWIGNVPSDTTHDELWRFLSQESPPADAAPSPDADDPWGGMLSIFLISRSNCAFVNLQSQAHLLAAIRHFNGQPLRPHEPRCPRLVCRVRAHEDDLKAGVGGQRSTGLHVRYVRDKKERAGAAGQEAPKAHPPTSPDAVATPASPPGAHAPSGTGPSSDEEGARGHRRHRRPEPHSSSSGSYASTTSSMLTQHFPKRYFILKSLTKNDLDISVEKGLWATQHHNEGTLDQAFRTSQEVYLIFGVNKSGEFYGYAKMAGPINRGEHRVSWSSRMDSPPQRRASRSSQGSSPPVARRDDAGPMFLSPSEFIGESPLSFSPDSPPLPPPPGIQQQLDAVQQPYDEGRTPRVDPDESQRYYMTAPPEMHEQHQRLSKPSLDRHQHMTADGVHGPSGFTLDPAAPIRHIREKSAPAESRSVREGEDAGTRLDRQPLESLLDTVADREGRPGPSRLNGAREGEEARESPTWGEPFKVQWIKTERLPFYRTRHLRNPWNHDREVKVSRDGTELEPSVGEALLREWDQPAPPPPITPSAERRAGSKTAAAEGAVGALSAAVRDAPPEEGG